MKDAQIFWNWFQAQNDNLIMLDDLDQEAANDLLDTMDQKLKEYSEGLSFEISEKGPNGRIIAFCCDSDIDYFEDVVELIENAPIMDWWEFLPFRQPKGNDLEMTYENYIFNTNRMSFLPLENEEDMSIFGLRIAHEQHIEGNEEEEESLIMGLYLLLEAMIGEFDSATLIGYIESCPLEEASTEQGFLPLTEFPDYVEWFKRESSSEEDRDENE